MKCYLVVFSQYSSIFFYFIQSVFCTIQQVISPVSEHETSIQCAQKEPSATGLTNSRKWQYGLTNQVVDLVSFRSQIIMSFLFFYGYYV